MSRKALITGITGQGDIFGCCGIPESVKLCLRTSPTANAVSFPGGEGKIQTDVCEEGDPNGDRVVLLEMI